MRLAVLYGALLFEFVSTGMVMPMLPFVATDLGASPFVLSTLVATTGAFMFLSMIFWGRMSDRIGRRPVLAITILGSGLAGALSGLSTSLAMLFVARATAGAMGGNVPIAVSTIADVTPDNERARMMAYLMAVVALGFVAGNALSSVIGSTDNGFNYARTGLVAGGLSIIGASLVHFFVPESHTDREPDGLKPQKNAMPSTPLPELKRLGLVLGVVGFAIAIQFMLQNGLQGAIDTVVPLHLKAILGWSAREFGFFMASVGVMLITIQVFATGPFTRRFGDDAALRTTMSMTAIGAIVALLPLPPYVAVVGIGLMMMGVGLSQPLFQSLVTKAAPAAHRGVFVGIVEAVAGLGRVIAPLIAGGLFQAAGAWLAFCFMAAMASGIVAWRTVGSVGRPAMQN